MKRNPFTAIANRLGLFTQKQMRSAAGFAVARVTRLTNSWTTSQLSADAISRLDLDNLRARSRDLALENAYARKFLWMLKTNVLGESGMLLQNKARDPMRVENGIEKPGEMDVFANSLIERHWKQWGKKGNCTVDRKLSWQAVNELALETVAVDGEVFIQMVDGFDNDYRFALRLYEADHLDIETNKKLSNGNEVRMGVELNPWGEPVAYWMRKRNPNDSYYGQNYDTRFVVIPANQMLHIGIKRRIHQTRYWPWMAPAMRDMKMLDAYRETEMVRARVDAAQGGWFKNNGGEGYAGEQDANGNTIRDVEPGQWEEIPGHLDPVPTQSNHPNPNFGTFNKEVLRGIAAALAQSYNVLAEDMEGVNFSSMRMGLLEPREGYKILQRWWSSELPSPVFGRWLFPQLISQKVPLPSSKFEKFKADTWKGKRWPYIEPNKDIDAAVKRMNANVSSLTEEVTAMGKDRDELLDEIVDDEEALKARGLQRITAEKPANNDTEDSDGMDSGENDTEDEEKKKVANEDE